jgi:vacuolar iron transporter family protein
VSDAPVSAPPEHHEAHDGSIAGRLNWLRAGVLGANDGIVSVAGLVVGVAGATSARGPILTAGVAGLVAGAVSMALGEYVSVSSQSDSEKALIEKERRELAEDPEDELAELTYLLQQQGMSEETARRAAVEVTEHDALGAHLTVELGIDADEVVNPWHAAVASAISFTIGGILPLLAILLPPPEWRIATTFAAVLVALAVAGWIGAWIGGGPRVRASVRVLVGGALALTATYLVGQLFGATGIA